MNAFNTGASGATPNMPSIRLGVHFGPGEGHDFKRPFWEATVTVARVKNSQAKGWFTVEVGALIRGTVRREIEAAAWGRGLEITTDESKGLLESVYRFTVRGDDRAVAAFLLSASALPSVPAPQATPRKEDSDE